MLQRSSLRIAASIILLAPAAMEAQSRRVMRPLDDGEIIRLRQPVHPSVAAARDLGRVAPDLLLRRMILLLKPAPEQEADLNRLLSAQQSPASADFHTWLTPEEFAERFGVAQSDINTIADWLRTRGLSVDGVAAGRRVVEFSGKTGDVEAAFQCELHRYEEGGELHFANASPQISIPAALAPAIEGVLSLHDFHSRPLHRLRAGADATFSSPLFNNPSGSHVLTPYDFSTIYDVGALWANSTDGVGQSIAVIGRTNVDLTDTRMFRSMFGLPANDPQIVLNGPDPGVTSADEATEANLDIEWAGAVAKAAQIKFVVSKSTFTTDGVFLSAQYAVDHNLAPVISVSFGACEEFLGTLNRAYSSLWQQASAQGISVVVASGDSGGAGCDAPSSSQAVNGLVVNGLASTPFNVAVGGTQFDDSGAPESYWNAVPDSHQSTARNYVPELAWNDSAAYRGLYAGGGGVSRLYQVPAWQGGLNVPGFALGQWASSQGRSVPDISLAAGPRDGYAIVQRGSLMIVGGTSAGAPAFAGIMALANQYTGTRIGNPNWRLYALAAQFPSAFHDITKGGNAVPCAAGSPDCSLQAGGALGRTKGYDAGPGYDLATGLGSVDAFNLLANWNKAVVRPAIVSVEPNPLSASETTQILTILGAGFQPDTGTTVLINGVSDENTRVVSVSAGEIHLSTVVQASTGSLSLQVVNSGGLPSNVYRVPIEAPAPAPRISSAGPSPLVATGVNQTISLEGSGFQSRLQIIMQGAVSPATILPQSQIAVIDDAHLFALVNLGSSPQTWVFQVRNPDGQISNAFAFQVSVPPHISSLSPSPITAVDADQVLTIAGSGFQPGPGLAVLAAPSPGMVTGQVPQIMAATESEIRATLNAGSSARVWTVQVQNPGGQMSNPVLVPVNATTNSPAPPPQMSSVDPNPISGSSFFQMIRITGSHFQIGATLKLGYPGFSTTTSTELVSVISSSEILALAQMGTVSRTWSVQIINPDGQISTPLALAVH